MSVLVGLGLDWEKDLFQIDKTSRIEDADNRDL